MYVCTQRMNINLAYTEPTAARDNFTDLLYKYLIQIYTVYLWFCFFLNSVCLIIRDDDDDDDDVYF